MLDGPDATNTKSIENYFHNLDQEIRTTDAQGFWKCGDNLVIKYSRDLVDEQHKWQTKTNRNTIADFKLKREVFDKNQKSLLAEDIDEEDAAKLATSNSVVNCVSTCKKSHGGPFTAVEELNSLIEKWKGCEKSLHTVLYLEIQFRKCTFLNVKATCPVFKQWGLSVNQKVTNLTTLISSELELRVLADMEDLQKAIKNVSNNWMKDKDKEIEIVQHDTSTHKRKEVINMHNPQ